MEAIEAELKEKSIERVVEPEPQPEPTKSIEKPKKQRTQAQKEAFEKARKKRMENLAKKKLEARQELIKEEEDSEDDETQNIPIQNLTQPTNTTPIPEPAKKRRGRPRKKKEEPPAPHFIPPTNSIPQNFYPIQSQAQAHFNPYQYWGGVMAQHNQPPQPIVNNYYYGSNPREIKETERVKEVPKEEPKPPTPEPVQVEQEVFEEEDLEYELPPDPRLKFRYV